MTGEDDNDLQDDSKHDYDMIIWSKFCLQKLVVKCFIWNLWCHSPLRNIPVLQGSKRKKSGFDFRFPKSRLHLTLE